MDIRNQSDFNDKLYQAEYAFDHMDWRTALGYFQACLQYAKGKGMLTAYIEMKIADCKEKLNI